MDGGAEALDNDHTAGLTTVAEGEWAGWCCFPAGDPFEDHAGPFYFRVGGDGRPVCAFRAGKQHMNRSGFLHGGLVMTFADFALFVIAREAIAGTSAVTATFSGEFV